ncbi:hypothetical protein EJB05_14839 [Eragrostis curvula]|uniref:Cathepsin propeptide inhibitor domain-containing protein n=1 Tax=Eragrostis curvula TaxID=38414 RepID=A0A5J9W078_9POAL|nr:hypothetical protein EJB05_14839 [Eragrostis curvula]
MCAVVPSMASVILIAFRLAASRCCAAVLSRSGLVIAAASDPLLPRRSSLSFYCSRSAIAALPCFKLRDPAPGKVEFVADEKDIVSDEAIWALYERWCKFFNEERSLDEMACRFHKFKKTVLRVDRNKKACLPYRLEINWFADGKNIELVSNKFPVRGRDWIRKRRHTLAFIEPPEGAGEFNEELERAAVEKEPEGAAGEFEKEH